MFKRFICCALICALIVAAIPAVAFAGASQEALKRLRKMRYIEQLCAVNDNAPDWHEGMSLQHANSQQMETALRSLLEKEILLILDYLEQTAVAQITVNDTEELREELRQARNECRAIRDEVQAALDIIEYERQSVPASVESVFGGGYLTENQTESAARRALLGVQRLENSMNVVSNSYSEWMLRIDGLRELVCADDPRTPRTITNLTPIQTHIVGVRAEYMSRMLEETKRIAAEEQGFAGSAFNRDDEVEIYAVPRNKILFDVRDAQNNPISDASVIAWNYATRDQFVGKYDADAEGYLFTTQSLGIESDGYLEIGYEIKRSGFESQFVNCHLCQGGDIFHTQMKAASGGSYISGASFNDEDMQWNQTQVYITDANDANQTITVYLDSESGKSSGTVRMDYTDVNGNAQSCTASAARGLDGRVQTKFTDEWCRVLQVGAPVSFSLEETNAEPVASSLVTLEPECMEAGGDRPQFQSDNETLLARFLPSEDFMKIMIPEDSPFFGGSSVGLSFPGYQVPITAYAGLDGTYLLLVTKSKEFEDFLDDEMDGDKWKTQSQAQTDRQVNKAVEKVGSEIKNAGSSFAKDENSVQKPFLGKYTAWWSIFFCAQGKLFNDEVTHDVKANGQVSAGFVVGYRAEFPKQFCAAPPLKFNIGVSFGVGAMLYGFYEGNFADCLGLNMRKLDIDFGAISLIITPAVFISLALGVPLAEVGVKGCISLNLALPIIAKDYGDNVGVSIDARVFIYGQLLLAHVEWLIARISWAYENGKSGEVNGYVIVVGHLPKNSVSDSGVEMPSATPPKSGFRFDGDAEPGESGTSSNSLDVDTTVIWDYEPASVNGSKGIRSASTLPKKFELYNSNTVDMAVWAEDNRIMISANGLDNAQELKIPDDPAGSMTPLAMAKKGIESGAYRIIDVNANSGDCHFDYVGSFQMPVQVGVVSVTYAKSFRTELKTIGEKTVEATVPDEIETLSMAIVLTMHSTTPLMLTTDKGAPAAYVFLNTTDSIKEFYPYPCQIHLKERQDQPGQPCIDTVKSFGIVTGALFEDGSLASAFYYYGNDDYYEEYSDCTFRLLKTGTAKDIPVYIGVDEDGTIVAGIFSNVRSENYEDFAEGEDVNDFVLFPIADTDGELAAFYLEKTDEEGVDALKAVSMQLIGSASSPRRAAFECISSEVKDFEIDIPSTKLNIDKIINYNTLNATLYWYDTGLKKIGGSEEKQEIARVRGVYFDWFHQKATKPFTIATLYGNDGDTGDLIPSLAPLTSFECNGEFYFARALVKDNKEGENDSVSWQQGDFMIYKAELTNVVRLRVVSAASEYHAMSAGRSGNFTFTLMNDGNMPISSATMRVSRILKNPDGSETKETVAEYGLNPGNESKNTASFWSVDTESPDVRTGLSAARQLDTIFDAIAGDPLDAANAVGDTPWIFKSFLPETVFAYKSSIAIPEDWDGLQLLRAEIVRAYGPIQTAGSDAGTQYAMYDLETGAVYAADAEGRVSGKPLLMAGGAPMKVEKPQPFELVIDTAEISLSAKMHEKNGEKYIASAISQTGNTALNSSRGNITLRAYVDDETAYPSFVHTFRNHTTGDITLNLNAPVSTLTGGRKADKLTLIATDAAEGNVDLSQLNNAQIFYLNEGLKWSVQPADTKVKTGGTAAFTAAVEGGAAPYTYQWLRISEAQPQVVGTGNMLILENCPDALNGSVYCCEAKDAAGQKIVSNPAKLCVEKVVPPPTGDDSHILLWSALLAASLLALLILARKRRSGQR